MLLRRFPSASRSSHQQRPRRVAFSLLAVAAACVLGLTFASTSVVGQCTGWYFRCTSCAAQATCQWCGNSGYSASNTAGTCIMTSQSCRSTAYSYSYWTSSSCPNYYSSSGGTAAGAIVGAVIGSIAFVVIACALCICIRRRYYMGGVARPGMVVIQQPAQAVVLSPQPVVYGSGQPASVHTIYAQQPMQPFQGQPQTMGTAQPVVYGQPQPQPGQQQPAYYAQPPPTYAQAYPQQQQQQQQQQPAYNPQYGEGMPQPAYAPQGQPQYAMASPQYGQPMTQYPPQAQPQPVYGQPANTTAP